MKQSHYWRRLLVAGLSLLAVFSLAACQSLAPQATSTPANTPTPTAAPTPTPLVLEGAVTTESGLQYLEMKAGDGPAPKKGDIISMHYIASLADGTELYNSYTQDQPSTLVWGTQELLKGWDEGIGLMKVGGKAKLVLTPELAFGAEGGGMIPPNAQIVIEIELLSAKPTPQPSSVLASKLQKTDSGLQYYDLTVGDGAEATKDSTVSMHYTVWVQGEPESQYVVSSEGQDPLKFVVGRGDVVFPGWDEGVVGMKVGGKRYLVVPPDLGLGEEAQGSIPANATLILEVELVEVREPQKPTVVEESDYITTTSGLKYYDLKVGEGVTPTVGQTVVVQYTGWLTDTTQFDSSLDRDEPFSFQLGMGGVIPGWDEGVAGMKVGGKRQLVIPASLGYGDTGSGIIPPGATLIFEIELLEIKP